MSMQEKNPICMEMKIQLFILEYHRMTMQSNYLHKGDVFELLQSIPDRSMHMVYAEPDYNVGIRYAGNRKYTKDWNEYIDWYGKLIQESMRVLKDEGNLFTMNYPKQNAYLRVQYLDAIAYDVFEYVWVYNTNIGHSPRRLTTAHRSILHATKSKRNYWNKDAIAEPYKNPEAKCIQMQIQKGSKGRMPYSWLNYELVKNVSQEKTFHACQIPRKLYELLLRGSTRPKDEVLILFGGSGGEILQTIRNSRNWRAAEINPEYCNLIEQRIETEIPSTLEHLL